jgi:hypothetical protein
MNKVYILIEGGLIQSIRAEEEIDVIVLDADVDDIDVDATKELFELEVTKLKSLDWGTYPSIGYADED